jgi:hypothetical protein
MDPPAVDVVASQTGAAASQAEAATSQPQASAAVEGAQASTFRVPEHWTEERKQEAVALAEGIREHRDQGGSRDDIPWEKLTERRGEELGDVVQDAEDISKPPPPDEGGAQPPKPHPIERLGYERPVISVTETSLEASRLIVDNRIGELPPERQEKISNRLDEIMEEARNEDDPHQAYVTMRQATQLVNTALGNKKDSPEFLEVSHDEEANRHGLTYAETLRGRVNFSKPVKEALAEMRETSSPQDVREVAGLIRDSEMQTKVEASREALSEVNLTILPISMHRGKEHPSIHGVEAAELKAMKELLTGKDLASTEDLAGLKHDQVYEKYTELYQPDDPVRQNNDLYDLVKKRYAPGG